jgi:hypothetical protein
MANIKEIIRLERDIIVKMQRIKSGTLTPKESEIGKSLNRLKTMDEPSFEKLMATYKQILLKNQD